MARDRRTEAAEAAEEALRERRHRRRRIARTVLALSLLLPFGLTFFVGLYALFGLAAVGLFWTAYESWMQSREFADTPTSKIRSAAQGYVELVAQGSDVDEEGRPIRGPVSGQPCCYWQLTAEREHDRGNAGRWWILALARSTPDLLPLSDGTGTCLLNLAEAEIETGQVEIRPATQAELQDKAHLFPEAMRPALAQPGTWRFREMRLPAGTDLYAVGRFRSLPSNNDPFDNGPFDRDWARRAVAADRGTPFRQLDAVDVTPQAATARLAEARARWQALVRRLEGIPPDALPGGTVMVHLLGPERMLERNWPLILSLSPEHRQIRQRLRHARTALFLGLATATVTILLILFAPTPSVQDTLTAIRLVTMRP